MEDEVKLCPFCDCELEEIVETGPFGRPIWGWFCSCCGTTFDNDNNVIEESHQFDENYELANKCRGYDLDED